MSRAYSLQSGCTYLLASWCVGFANPSCSRRSLSVTSPSTTSIRSIRVLFKLAQLPSDLVSHPCNHPAPVRSPASGKTNDK